MKKDFSNNVMQVMETIEYGFLDEFGENIYNKSEEEWDKFSEFYYLLSPEELLDKKCGVCWDQVELERKLFKDFGIATKTYFIYISDGDIVPSHTFLVYEDDGKYCWFEHSWEIYVGIHEYESLNELFVDVKKKFVDFNRFMTSSKDIYMFEYDVPPVHIGCDDFYRFVERQKEININ